MTFSFRTPVSPLRRTSFPPNSTPDSLRLLTPPFFFYSSRDPRSLPPSLSLRPLPSSPRVPLGLGPTSPLLLPPSIRPGPMEPFSDAQPHYQTWRTSDSRLVFDTVTVCYTTLNRFQWVHPSPSRTSSLGPLLQPTYTSILTRSLNRHTGTPSVDYRDLFWSLWTILIGPKTD